MKGIEFKDQNCNFGKPSEMTDKECYSLPAKKTTNGNFPAIESVFELSDEELAIITKSKRIRLGIIGTGMPPLYLQAELPEDSPEERDELLNLPNYNESRNLLNIID